MSELPTLRDLLAVTCLAEIARRVGVKRSLIWRLRHGQILRDHTLIAPLAQALHRDEAFIRSVCQNDARRARANAS